MNIKINRRRFLDNAASIVATIGTMGLFSFCRSKPDEDDENKIEISRSGKVLCQQGGVPGVVVTDGTNMTQTDETGFYSLPYNASATHFYISSPAGYTVPVGNSVPRFWVLLADISDKKNINFNIIKLETSDTRHYFVALADPQVRNTTEVARLRPIVDSIKKELSSKSPDPVHIMVAGDIVFNKPLMHEESKACFSSLEQPVYYAIGNHDHTFSADETPSSKNDKAADDVFVGHYGPTCYSFNRGNIHYLVLDNICFEGGANAEYTTYFTQEQLTWVEKDLSYVDKNKVLVVMIHAPSKSRDKSSYGNSSGLFSLLAGYKEVHIISGHTHYHSTTTDNTGVTEHNIGAACGGFWEGPVCLDGTRLGYKLFEINDTDVKWLYRAYDDAEAQYSVFVPKQRASVLRPANELLVNVWDWDPAWSVAWSEDNGDTFPEMTRITDKTYDPEAYDYFGLKGENKIPDRSFIASKLTDHIFTCVPAEGTSSVIIRVVNRFKTEYIKEVFL